MNWELAELYVKLKQTMELEIELVKKLDEDLKFIEKIVELRMSWQLV